MQGGVLQGTKGQDSMRRFLLNLMACGRVIKRGVEIILQVIELGFDIASSSLLP